MTAHAALCNEPLLLTAGSSLRVAHVDTLLTPLGSPAFEAPDCLRTDLSPPRLLASSLLNEPYLLELLTRMPATEQEEAEV